MMNTRPTAGVIITAGSVTAMYAMPSLAVDATIVPIGRG